MYEFGSSRKAAMGRNERAIFGLVAQGRISAAEAERLLFAANESREVLWLAAAALAVAALGGMHPEAWRADLVHGAWVAAQAIPAVLHQLLAFAIRFCGGIQ